MSVKIESYEQPEYAATTYVLSIPHHIKMSVSDEVKHNMSPDDLKWYVKQSFLSFISNEIDEAFDKAEEEAIQKLKWTADGATTVNIQGNPINLLPGDSVELGFDLGFDPMGAGGFKFAQMKLHKGADFQFDIDVISSPPPITSTEVGKTLSVFPGLNEKIAVCPGGCMTELEESLRYLIIHLNDEHKWTREQIADWLETLDVNINMEEENANNSNPGAFDAGHSPSA